MKSATEPRKTPTVDDLKAWAKDCQPAARAVLMARVFADMERERVDAYVKPIFDSYKFEYAQRWQEVGKGLIPSPKELYLCDDEPMLKSYYADCDDAHRAHGFKGKPGHCPALVAEHLLMVTETAFMDLATPLFGIESGTVYGDNRVKYLELLIGACFAKDNK